MKHEKQIFFRTWDIFPDKLHASLPHYLEVTDQVEPHARLVFSIKHTALDFWRHTKVNECLTQGRHPQIIEVQCQREYEGKGAFPNYVMDGVINGFEENAKKIGLRDLIGHPKILGVYSWSRGGGWYGPYIENELWPDLNAFVLAQFAKNPTRTEEAIFREYAGEHLGLGNDDLTSFRELCLTSARAILQGRHCALFDRILSESVLPTACWMRDDRLGGHEQLADVLNFLHQNNLGAEALREKYNAVRLWERIAFLARQIEWDDRVTQQFAVISAEYGLKLFSVVAAGWRVMLAGQKPTDQNELESALAAYDLAWADYQSLAAQPGCPTLYIGNYFNLPGQPEVAGLSASVLHYRRQLHLEAVH